MRERGFSLRAILAVTTIVTFSLALLVAGTLIALTTILHRTTADAATSVESVRLAQEAQIDLLLHGRTNSALFKRDVEERLRRRLFDARLLVASEREERAAAEANARVEDYILTSRDPNASLDQRDTTQAAAYAALEALVNVNVAFARQARASADAWDRRANYVGTSASILLVVVAAGLLFWLRNRAFAPLFSLLATVERFGKGDRDARAAERGPTELREMSRRFNELAVALATQRQAQAAFLGGVAHDLRNPLSILQMSVALLPPDRPLPPEPRLRQTIDKIRRQISRLERMASDFLDMAQIEAGELELCFSTHDGRQLVRQVVDLFAGTSPEPHIVVSVPDEPVELQCDHQRLEQVLTNLVSNAIKYSPSGSAIEVALEPGGDTVAFRVTDHGIGIPEAQHEAVFEPFRRVGPANQTVPGAGLGLFMVRRVVEAHGGWVDLESAPDVGSTFSFHVPRVQAEGLDSEPSTGQRPAVH